jgi:hypothetical protein
MDFMNRGNQTTQQAQRPEGAAHTPKANAKLKGNMNWDRISQVGFLAAIVVLVVAVVFSLLFTKGVASEERFVDKSKYQAVFLNGGQVYFGKISDLNSQYMKVSNIYYLRVNQQVQPDQQNNNAAQNDISLVKLGCELHGPQDDMVINREQVIFWENLKDDGQVAKAVAEYVKQNPGGQKCDQNQSSTTNTTPTNNNTTNTTTENNNNTTTPNNNTNTSNQRR